MASLVLDVVVTIHIKLPGSNVIKVEEVLKYATGTLTEALEGGQSTVGLTLTSAKELRPLHPRESVFVRGTRDGSPFTLPGSLQTTQQHEPWKFEGRFEEEPLAHPAQGARGSILSGGGSGG